LIVYIASGFFGRSSILGTAKSAEQINYYKQGTFHTIVLGSKRIYQSDGLGLIWIRARRNGIIFYVGIP
jgi:hypothetical protein